MHAATGRQELEALTCRTLASISGRRARALALWQSVCTPIITSAFGPNATSILSAISGDRSLRSFKNADNACRLTPSAAAAAVTLSPNGRITSSRMTSPGCGGFFMGPTSGLAAFPNVQA